METPACRTIGSDNSWKLKVAEKHFNTTGCERTQNLKTAGRETHAITQQVAETTLDTEGSTKLQHHMCREKQQLSNHSDAMGHGGGQGRQRGEPCSNRSEATGCVKRVSAGVRRLTA